MRQQSSLRILRVVAVTILFVAAVSFQFVLAARGPAADKDPKFWQTHAVVLLRATKSSDQLEGQIVQVMSGAFPVPRSMFVVGAIKEGSPAFREGQLFLVCVEKHETQWWLINARTEVPLFMPQAFGMYELAGEQDREIQRLRDRIYGLQNDGIEWLRNSVGKTEDKLLRTTLESYTTYWKTRTLTVAKLSKPAGHETAQADIQSVLFAPLGSPTVDKPLALPNVPDGLTPPAAEGRWAILLLVNTDKGWAIDAQREAPPFMPNGSGVVQVKDANDPIIDQIVKAVQGWQRRIVEAGGPAPPLSSPTTTSTSTAPAANDPANGR
jgi:hypothetical protein